MILSFYYKQPNLEGNKMPIGKGLFTCKSEFALGLQVYNTNNIFLYSKTDKLFAKSCYEIGHVNKP